MWYLIDLNSPCRACVYSPGSRITITIEYLHLRLWVRYASALSRRILLPVRRLSIKHRSFSSEHGLVKGHSVSVLPLHALGPEQDQEDMVTDSVSQKQKHPAHLCTKPSKRRCRTRPVLQLPHMLSIILRRTTRALFTILHIGPPSLLLTQTLGISIHLPCGTMRMELYSCEDIIP
jgi:hypothetical protein